MATTQLRDAVAGLNARAQRDLMAVWRATSDAAKAGAALHDLLPSLVAQYGAAAATLAATWYDDLRAKQEIPGHFQAIPTDVPDTGTHALVGWALTEASDYPAFQSLVTGGMQRRIADWSRLTVAESSIADPQADGWQRVGNGSCAFCRMLIGRGAVYTEAAADFASHDHCNCSAVPAFGGKPRPVKPYTVSPRRTIDPETGKPVIDADFLRAKAWIKSNL